MSLPNIKYAPWTKEEVDNLNRYQACLLVHPYTCDCDETKMIAKTYTCDCGETRMIAKTDGLHCRYCPNWQQWAQTSALNFDETAKQKILEGYKLLEASLREVVNERRWQRVKDFCARGFLIDTATAYEQIKD